MGQVAIGCEDVTLEAEPRGGKREHPPELTAAEDADGGSGLENRRRNAHAPDSLCGVCFECVSGSLGFSAIAAVCFCRQASRRWPSAGSLSAKTLAAKSAALMAPALPIASVPTVCRVASARWNKASPCPDRALDSTGTPKTGRW